MDEIKITIVGAGVIGLAVADELSKTEKDIFVIERNSTFGQETSSRNSEVIHAGLYYAKNALKTTTCIEGRKLLYEFCASHNVNHKKTGKLIVAMNSDELKELHGLYKNGLDNGINELVLIDKAELKKMEPHVSSEAAIFSPSTGIIDSHGFMKALADEFKVQGGQIAYNTQLNRIEKTRAGFRVSVTDKNEGSFTFSTHILINCAGLDSDQVAQLAGIKNNAYCLKYCKGDYFRVTSAKSKFISRLVYPVPKEDRAGLGIHATLDLAGSLRLGPDDEYVDKIDYEIDAKKQKIFYESTKGFLPFIELQDLNPDMAGIRPKLQGPGEGFRDFLIKEETENGLPGLINLVGIESPGLTASLSIAKLVKRLTQSYLP